MNIVILGAPGSGKGTQASELQVALGLVHVATGDLFRDNLNRQTPLGLLAREYMNRGELVPDHITIEMLQERLSQPDVSGGMLLDGFPRTLPQAQALKKILTDLSRRLRCVLYISVPDEDLVSRLSGRLICRECQVPFHKLYNPFRSCPENRCHGEFLYQREDDKPDTVRARLRTFHAQTEPLIDFYRREGLIVEADGSGSVAEVRQACLKAIESVADSD